MLRSATLRTLTPAVLIVLGVLLLDAPAALPGPAGRAQLTYWMQSDPTLEAAMDSIVQSYVQAHPGVTVKREAFPFGEYFQKLLTAFAGGTAPDVMWIDVRTAAFASRGTLFAEQPYVTQENKKEVLPSAFVEGRWNGKLYAMPLHQITEVLYVNRRMAEAAGVRLPRTLGEAWGWDEFVDIARRLTVREGDQTKVWGFGMDRHLQDWSLVSILAQNRGAPLSPDLRRATGYLNGPASVEAMRWFGELFTKHRIISADLIPEGFPSGRIAIYQAPSIYRATLARRYPNFEYLVVPLYRGKRCGVTVGGWNVGLSETAKDKPLAWSLVDWVTRVKHADWVEKSGYLPIRTSVLREPKFAQHPWSLFMEELTKCPVSRPPTPKYQFFADTFNAAIKDIALGGDPQKILDAAAARIDAELTR